MERAVIPERFPAVDGDLIMSSAIDVNIGLFTNNIEVEFSHKLDRSRLFQARNPIFDAQADPGLPIGDKGWGYCLRSDKT